MNLNSMALRTLVRNRRRTIITSFSVAFGIFLAVTFTGSGDYSYTKMIDTSAVMGFGHVSVEAAGYNDKPSLARWFPESDAVRNMTAGIPTVTGSYPRVIGQAMFAAGAKSAGGMFMAIDPALEDATHNFFLRSVVEGKMFETTAGRGAIIGVEMAKKLNVRPGKKLIITVTDKNGQLASELLRISGLFSTGDHAADSGIVLVPLERMQKTLGYSKNGATLVAVYVDDQRQVGRLKKQLTADLSGRKDVEVLTWHDTQSDLSGLIAVDKLFNYLLQLLVGLVIAAGITNTMLMSVLERTREFGIMMALGMTPGQTVRMVLIESFWVGCLGVVLGILVTAPWFYFMSKTGIDLSGYVGGDYSAGGVLVDPVMKLRLFKESAAVILVTVFFLTIGAGVYPAFRAGKIIPVETIKEI